MPKLRSLDPLSPELAADETDIAREFYCPSLAASNHYARISGYFSSLIYLIAWPEMKEFICANDGKMRLICSPHLSLQDAQSIRFGYTASTDSELVGQLRQEMAHLLSEPELREPARLLACLVANEIVQIKLAEIDDDAPASIKRMFHDKVGVFSDSEGDHVGFRGSMNETFLGLSPDLGHIDSIDIFPSWVGGRDRIRVINALQRFNSIWSGEPRRVGVRLRRLPPEIEQDLKELGEEVDLMTALKALEGRRSEEASEKKIGLRPHQLEALEEWEKRGSRGILAHATGSGKTVTGVFAIKRKWDYGVCAVVVVPSKEIQQQWVDEITKILAVRSIKCGGGHGDWKKERLVRAAVESPESQVIVAVLATARSPAFRAQMLGGQGRTLLIVDEVHRAGANDASKLLTETDPEFRLGLSATPERAGDPVGTQKILDFFQGIVHRYGLADAIADGYLCPYTYDVETVFLTEDEQERWDEWTARIRRLAAQSHEDPSDQDLRESLRRAQQERAKIKKGAAAKARVAVRRLREEYELGDRWLVYCDNQNQLNEVLHGLSVAGLPAQAYHSQMSGDRDQALEWFKARGGILVSMKCLDEGVDIPRANRGLILASSTNKREFIQRRGRLLRKGGTHAVSDLMDILVLPLSFEPKERAESLLGPEVSRALLFAQDSVSGHAVTKLEKLWVDSGLDLEDLDEMAARGHEEDASEAQED